MKRSKDRRIATPPNVAAKALGERQFKLKIVKNKRDYSRKTKHKKGFLDNSQEPFLLWCLDALRIHNIDNLVYTPANILRGEKSWKSFG